LPELNLRLVNLGIAGNQTRVQAIRFAPLYTHRLLNLPSCLQLDLQEKAGQIFKQHLEIAVDYIPKGKGDLM
jgi:hypothetical protein